MNAKKTIGLMSKHKNLRNPITRPEVLRFVCHWHTTRLLSDQEPVRPCESSLNVVQQSKRGSGLWGWASKLGFELKERFGVHTNALRLRGRKSRHQTVMQGPKRIYVHISVRMLSPRDAGLECDSFLAIEPLHAEHAGRAAYTVGAAHCLSDTRCLARHLSEKR